MTPASSNSEETHNTLKFAHRSKHVEIKASQNKVNIISSLCPYLLIENCPSAAISSFLVPLILPQIMDEKSLIKKYQNEISSLKQELQQLKYGIMQNPNMAASTQEDLVNLKLQVYAGK